MLTLLIFAVAFVLFCMGGAAYVQALGHLKPEYRHHQSMFAFMVPARYDGEGECLLRRGWAFQAAGVALLILCWLIS